MALPLRTQALAHELAKKSRLLAELAKTQSKTAQAKSIRRSKGLASSAKDTGRCLSMLVVETKPKGSLVRLDGELVGKTPVKRPVFGGEHTVSVESQEGQTLRKVVTVKFGATQSVDFEFLAKEKPNDCHPANNRVPNRKKRVHYRQGDSLIPSNAVWMPFGSGA